MASDPSTNADQQLRAAIWYTVDKICHEEGETLDLDVTPQFVACLGDIVYKHLAHVAEDLAMFSKHGKRVQINTDDVKLLARKNPDLHSHLAGMATQLTKADSSAPKSKKK